MIYCCDACHFIFERVEEVDACVDCGKPSVREATDAEKDEYRENHSMWQCPKCGRAFRSEDQPHFCGKAETIDQYIAEQTDEVRPLLQKIREVIRSAAPDSTERMSWQMPTFWQGENLIHFAAFKKHIGIYPGGEATAFFAGRLTEYKTAKGTIRLPLGKPVPYELIADITRWRVEQAAAGKSKRRELPYPSESCSGATHLS
jgi:uncharacterized protein YdhG (YjbR/CyaY superfamily)